MNGFVGKYEHQMDQKGRVSLPSAFRREADGDRFILLRWEPDYLTLFPEKKWWEIQEKLVAYRQGDAKAWNRVRLILETAVEVSPDKQGRILIPAALQSEAGLDGSILLCGNIDRVELWNPERYRTQVREQAADISDIAHRLFG